MTAPSGPSNRVMSVELLGWRGKRGRFVAVSKTARERAERAGHNWLKVATPLAGHESPIGARRPGDNRPRFRDSWVGTVTQNADGAEVLLSNKAPHAPFVIFPTKPHEITPVRAPFLVFEGSGPGTGTWRRTRRVWHPGTPGNDVPARVLRAMESWGEQELGRVAREVLAAIADVFSE